MARKQNILAKLISDRYSDKANQTKAEKILFYIFLIISFFTVVIIYFKADSPYDTGDGIVHYQIARYSWKYPHLLLDLWGKPFFTLISSPFAQFGLKGMYLFQALNSVVISWFLFSIASKLKLKYTWTIPVFIFFSPVYFAIMNSGLVEIFFGTMFMFSAWFVFNKKYYASALVASIIPFVRPEAYVVIPLLIVIYVYRKKYFAIPLLFTATIIYTLIGYFIFKDILWIIHQNYKLIGDNYAGMKGSYLHYFGLYNQIWGPVYAILLILGSGVIISKIYGLFKHKQKHEFIEEVFVLFLGSAVGCFILHSLLYGMPGILNNLGMLRYLAVLIPSSAIIALIGLNLINRPNFIKIRFLRYSIVLIAVTLIILTSFTQWFFPFKPYNEQIVMKQMANYIQTNWPNFKKVCFLHPSLPVLADLDPYDKNKVETFWAADLERLNQIPDSTLFLWDSHFMKLDGRIPFNWLSENPNFIMLKHYKFSDENRPFEAGLFIRAANPAPVPVPFELVSPDGNILKNPISESTAYSIDNNQSDFLPWLAFRTSFSGRNAITFTPEMEFGPKFTKKIGVISNGGKLSSIKLNFNLNQADILNKLVAVIEIMDNDKLISWEGLIIKQTVIANQWNSIELSYSYIEQIKEENYNVNIYIWNKEKQQFYIDDFQIIFQSFENQK